jgi:PAS domain S-box-containing protein
MDASGERLRLWSLRSRLPRVTPEDAARIVTEFLVPLIAVLLAYYVAGRAGQATTSIRSSNLGPVWPAYGIALAAFLAYGSRVWPAVAAGAFLVAVHTSVSAFAAAGQAAGATAGALIGAFVLQRSPRFDPSLPRLPDALGLIVFGAFGSALVSSLVGVSSLYASGIQPYSGLAPAWLIYWLGDSTGVLLVTPLVFTLPRLLRRSSRSRLLELALLLALLTAACSVVFGDLPFFPIRLHVLAFAVLPFVVWAAIGFGTGGAALSVFLVAVIATVLTAMGFGPFAAHTPFINGVLLDVLFIVLSVSGLTLSAVISERERAESEREALIRQQAALEPQLHLAAIVESSEDAIWSEDLNGTILSWNDAAHHIFGFRAAEAVGQAMTIIVPPERVAEENAILRRLSAGVRVVHRETTAVTKSGTSIGVSLTVSPLRNAAGELVGVAKIARDVGDQIRAREALSAVNRRLIEVQEQERTRIARELHDDIGQRLALLSADLTSTALSAEVSAQGGSEKLQQIQMRLTELSADLQTMSHNLHSAKLELLGLASAIRHFCEEFAQQHRVTVALDAPDLPRRLTPEVRLCLYRVLQEALHNAAKHSGSLHFEVQLRATREEVHLVIADRGQGFDLSAARGSWGIGLVSMQERIKMVGGDLSIDSAPHQGTTVHARVPFPSSGTVVQE